ncbi:MAG: hypothetical protein ACX939_15455, partial [Hyphococcus sp.]
MSAPSAMEQLKHKAATAFADAFDAVLDIAPSEGGAVRIDGRQAPPTAVPLTQAPDSNADCVWRGTTETILRALDNEKALESAYVAGRLQIAGD